MWCAWCCSRRRSMRPAALSSACIRVAFVTLSSRGVPQVSTQFLSRASVPQLRKHWLRPSGHRGLPERCLKLLQMQKLQAKG
ncbi:hypothetical protein BU25DRAFT_161011 [Macroventuria anomochaeta]|uniref:Uncharacterized protein n=1 Tax=Macroventuria anomochaeta TaxID=301207 RepID=A0ACB6RRQ7_9PLEO|nr:uncharacterized protein BU25DRAFT_161011 [Macroventuria anomochaeta]KAF2624418.1 hypothetical protein BU25DRAFT_161011 [Macroventuria anomochaeta]